MKNKDGYQMQAVKKTGIYKRLICLMLMLSMLLVPLNIIAAEPTVSAKKAANKVNNLESGVYRIRNSANGNYIDAYDKAYDPSGSAYLDKASGEMAQDIYVKRNSDGTYSLYPQSESGKYAFSASKGSSDGRLIKIASDNIGNSERFVIYSSQVSSDGSITYTVSGAGEGGLTLGVSSEQSRYKHNYVSLEKFKGTQSQQWYFEPVETEGISLAFKSTRVKLYAVGTLYATLTPYNFAAKNVKWTSSDESILIIDGNGNYSAIAPGTVKVTAECGGRSASCTVTVSSETAFTWYSQHSTVNSDWNADLLSGIYFTAGGVRKRFMIDQYGRGRDWMDEGCYLSAIAMIFHNMGARLTHGYDFRSGQTNNLPADPYTVALANSGNEGARSPNSVLYGNPILISRSKIDSRFNVNGKPVASSVSYNVSKKAIKEALDEHPEGIIVYFTRAGRTHYIVFTKCLNPTEKNPNKYIFEVCDSASYDAARGDHVPFEKCISYTAERYRYSNAVCIITWKVVG